MRGSSTIGRAAIIVSLGILVSRALGFVRQAVIVALLGVTDLGSLYTNAFFFPDLLTFLLAGGYLSITLVPLLSRHLVDGDVDGANETFTAVFRVVGLAFVVLAAVSVAAAGPIVAALFPAVEDQGRLTELTRIALASQVFFGLGILLMAAQYAHKRFVIPSLAPLLYNLGIIAGGVVGWLAGDPSPEAFLWGGLVGAAVGNFGVQWLGARRAGFRLVGGVPWRHPVLVEYVALAFPLMVGLSAVALDEQWPRLFGQYAGDGAEVALTSARQLNMLPVGVIAQAAGVAAYPFLASLAAERRFGEMGSTVVRSVRAAVAVGALAGALVIALALPIVTVAFQRGEVTPSDSRLMAEVLMVFALAIPFWPAHQVYTRGFYALGRMWVPVIVGTAITVVLVPVLWGLTDALGATGVAVGSSLGVIAYTLAIGTAWHRMVAPTGVWSLLGFVPLVTAVAVVAGLAGLGGSELVDRLGGPMLARLVVGGGFGVVVYVAAGRLLGLDEITGSVDRIVARLPARFRPGRRPATDEIGANP